MKWLILIVSALLVALGLAGVVAQMQTETEVSVHPVKAGVECAVATSAKGVAISCWKVKP